MKHFLVTTQRKTCTKQKKIIQTDNQSKPQKTFFKITLYLNISSVEIDKNVLKQKLV